jgi:hypothetical protein
MMLTRLLAVLLFVVGVVACGAAHAATNVINGVNTVGQTWNTFTTSPNAMSGGASQRHGGPGFLTSSLTFNDARAETFAAGVLAADGVSPVLRAKAVASPTVQARAGEAWAFAMQTYQYTSPAPGTVSYQINLHADVNDPTPSVIGRAAGEVALVPENANMEYVDHFPTLWFEVVPTDVRAVSDRTEVALNSTITDGAASDTVSISLQPGQHFYLAMRLDAGAAWFGMADATQTLSGQFVTGGEHVQPVGIPEPAAGVVLMLLASPYALRRRRRSLKESE